MSADAARERAKEAIKKHEKEQEQLDRAVEKHNKEGKHPR
jgi:hypothetical protein